MKFDLFFDSTTSSLMEVLIKEKEKGERKLCQTKG